MSLRAQKGHLLFPKGCRVSVGEQKSSRVFPRSFRYFLKCMLFTQFTIIAGQNQRLKSFSHQNPLYKLFQLQGICP